MIKEPNVRFIFIFFEWNSEAIGYIQDTVVAIFSHESTDDSPFGIFGNLIVVIDYGEKDCWMDWNNFARWCNHLRDHTVTHFFG